MGDVAADDPDERGKPDQTSETDGARGAPCVQLHAGDPRGQAPRQGPRGPTEAGADVEHAAAGTDAGAPGQRLDGPQSPVVILVEVEQRFRRHAAGQETATAERRDDLVLADRMLIVEANGVHGGQSWAVGDRVRSIEMFGSPCGCASPYSSQLEEG